MPKLSEFLFGSKEKKEQQPLLSPQQQQLQEQLLMQLMPLLQQGGGYLSSLFEDDSTFTDPYMRQFYEQTVPALAERFSAVDGQGSSAFAQQLGSAGAGLSENLAALQGQLKGQGIGQLMSLLGTGLQPTSATLYRPATQGLGPQLFGALGSYGLQSLLG